MKKILGVLIVWAIAGQAGAQKVGLVLSGGAAKGLAHIGVLKALEEHEIPIDYIVGTSMGGVVGGFYAAGYSPAQMEALVNSPEFMRWIRGLPETNHNYHYYNHEDTPGIVTLNLSLDSLRNFQLNSTLASDVSLNFVLTEKLAHASAVARGNFDSLFVPLRVVAADVFTQSEVILKSGLLADALRATLSVPLFYAPVKVDGKYLFDGGLYNNFPVDVAIKEFSPDVLIGSNVSSKVFKQYPYDRDEQLIGKFLLYMLLDNADPEQLSENGIYIEPDVSVYTAFDFSKASALIDSGYQATLRLIPAIKSCISSSRSVEEVKNKREKFLKNTPPLFIERIGYRGFNSRQQRYISRIFQDNPRQVPPFTLEQIKTGYYKLVAEPYFANIYPSLEYRPESNLYTFYLTRRPQRNFNVTFGGAVASRNISNVMLALNYYYFSRILTHTYASFQTGSFYQSFIGNTRIDFTQFGRFYIQPELVHTTFNHLEISDLLKSTSTVVLKRLDRRFTLTLGWPVGKNISSFIRLSAIDNSDRFSNRSFFTSLDTLDFLRLSGFRITSGLSSSTLNRKQYASSGSAFALQISAFSLNENYRAGSTADPLRVDIPSLHHQWFRLSFQAEQYLNKGSNRIGYAAEAVISNQPVFANFKGTLINAPAFLPFQDSRTLILKNFRTFNYAALGIRHILMIRPDVLEFRLNAFLFKPLQFLSEGAHQEAVITRKFRQAFLAASAGPVYHSALGPVSLSLNYYNDPDNQLGILLHVGFLLFNRHGIDQ
jgi:NTE family protein